MELFSQFDTWVALLTLTFLEIVLGIDNIIFISNRTTELKKQKRDDVVELLDRESKNGLESVWMLIYINNTKYI